MNLNILKSAFLGPMCESEDYCPCMNKCKLPPYANYCDTVISEIGVRELTNEEKEMIAIHLFFYEINNDINCLETSVQLTGFGWYSSDAWISEMELNCNDCINAEDDIWQCENCHGKNFKPVAENVRKYIKVSEL